MELLVGLSYSSRGTICRVCGWPQVNTRVEKWHTILVLEGTTIPETDNERQWRPREKKQFTERNLFSAVDFGSVFIFLVIFNHFLYQTKWEKNLKKTELKAQIQCYNLPGGVLWVQGHSALEREFQDGQGWTHAVQAWGPNMIPRTHAKIKGEKKIVSKIVRGHFCIVFSMYTPAIEYTHTHNAYTNK